MWHYVVVEIEQSRQYNQAGGFLIEQCWNILYSAPVKQKPVSEQRGDTTYVSLVDDELSITGCLAWIENNKAEGSKYAVMKMYLI